MSVDEVEELLFTAGGLASGLERGTSFPCSQARLKRQSGAEVNWSNLSQARLFLQVEDVAHRIP